MGRIIFNKNTVPVSLQKTFVPTLRFKKTKVKRLLAPTGVAAINTNATNIYSGLNTPVACFGKRLSLLNHKMKSMLRN